MLRHSVFTMAPRPFLPKMESSGERDLGAFVALGKEVLDLWGEGDVWVVWNGLRSLALVVLRCSW